MTLCGLSPYIWISLTAVSFFISLLPKKNNAKRTGRTAPFLVTAGILALAAAICSVTVRLQFAVFAISSFVLIFFRLLFHALFALKKY